MPNGMYGGVRRERKSPLLDWPDGATGFECFYWLVRPS